MCGIVGYFDYTRGLYHINPELFDKIIDTMAHRGPDGRGKFQLPGIGLGHRRLAILDTSEKGAQPMCDPDRQVWLVSNGEIYNFLDLRRELSSILFGGDGLLPHGKLILLRTFRINSDGLRDKCTCYSEITKEGSEECLFCMGEGYFWDEHNLVGNRHLESDNKYS